MFSHPFQRVCLYTDNGAGADDIDDDEDDDEEENNLKILFQGVCISADSGAVCECRNIDWEGEFCHIGELDLMLMLVLVLVMVLIMVLMFMLVLVLVLVIVLIMVLMLILVLMLVLELMLMGLFPSKIFLFARHIFHFVGCLTPNENVEIKFDSWIDAGLRRPLGAGAIAENVTNLRTARTNRHISYISATTRHLIFDEKITQKKNSKSIAFATKI